MYIMCVCVRACACVCVCARVCMCVRVRERETEREREFCPLSGFRYTGTLRPVPVYRTEATRIGALGITAAYRQPYSRAPLTSTISLSMTLASTGSQKASRKQNLFTSLNSHVCQLMSVDYFKNTSILFLSDPDPI